MQVKSVYSSVQHPPVASLLTKSKIQSPYNGLQSLHNMATFPSFSTMYFRKETAERTSEKNVCGSRKPKGPQGGGGEGLKESKEKLVTRKKKEDLNMGRQIFSCKVSI